MISIAVDNVSLSYGTDIILDNISFSLNDGDKLGIVGVNGAGKSSLLSIIMGDITEYEGNVYISKSKTVGFLAQNAEYSSDKSVYEAVLDVFSDLVEMENELDRLENLSLNGDESMRGAWCRDNHKDYSPMAEDVKQKWLSYNVVVVDTLNGIMIGEEMRRSREKGFDKWTDLASYIYSIIGF